MKCRTIHEPHHVQITKERTAQVPLPADIPATTLEVGHPLLCPGDSRPLWGQAAGPARPSGAEPQCGSSAHEPGLHVDTRRARTSCSLRYSACDSEKPMVCPDFDRALAHSFETCRSDGHRPGSKQLLSDPPAAQPGQANPPPHRHCVPVTDTIQVLIPHLVLKPRHKPRVGRCVGALPPPGALKEVATGQGRRLGTRS